MFENLTIEELQVKLQEADNEETICAQAMNRAERDWKACMNRTNNLRRVLNKRIDEFDHAVHKAETTKKEV